MALVNLDRFLVNLVEIFGFHVSHNGLVGATHSKAAPEADPGDSYGKTYGFDVLIRWHAARSHSSVARQASPRLRLRTDAPLVP
jgi:hypothetical protein